MKNILFVLGTVFGISLTSTNIFAVGVSFDLVKCRIDINNRTVVNGNCSFIPEKGGSFALTSEYRNTLLFGDIHYVDVNINKNGTNSIIAYDLEGKSYGNTGVVRSKTNKGCWEGKTMRVCAWK